MGTTSSKVVGRRSRRLTAAALVLVLAGCSASPSESIDPAFLLAVDSVLDDARSGGGPSGVVASDQQIALLERVRAQGEVTWGDAMEAIDASAACLEEQGFWLRASPPDETGGFAVPEYTWGGPSSIGPDGQAAVGDACIDSESFFVEQLYATQPIAVQARDAWFNTRMKPVLVACLKRNGVEVDAEASEHDLLVVSFDYFDTVIDANDGDIDRAVELGADCWGEAEFAAE